MNRLLRAAVEEQGNDWDEIIPFIMFSYRATPHSATRISPYFLMFGRSPSLPSELLQPCPPTGDDSDVESDLYVQHLVERLRKASAVARKRLGEAAMVQKKWYDQRVKKRIIPNNTPVWLHDPQFQRLKKGKLSFPWRGPYLHLYELDQGRNFESQLFQEFCETFEILKTRTTPLHPQSDGFIERSFRTINRLLRAAVEEQGNDWDEIIPVSYTHLTLPTIQPV